MIVLLRGGGDLASGVAIRLHRAGLPPVITELPRPLAVRRMVAFSEAVYAGRTSVEGVEAVLAESAGESRELIRQGRIPVLVDPEASSLDSLGPAVLVDARMTKREPDLPLDAAPFYIGLGPGFEAGRNCHALVETQRGHTLGRVIWRGSALPDTGVPEPVGRQQAQRVLRAPAAGVIHALVEICDLVRAGEPVAEVAGRQLRAPFDGVVRGLLRSGTPVSAGMKVGDVDPRSDPANCRLVSDKSLAIAGGVLEAILSRPELRPRLWDDD
jgi:xanthine dehydrogenase accessory factor